MFVSDISKFVFGFVKQKISKGFKNNNSDFGNGIVNQEYIVNELEHNKHELNITLAKGNEYTTVYCYKSTPKNNYAPEGSPEELENRITAKYNFYITTGDLRRDAGSKGKKFDF